MNIDSFSNLIACPKCNGQIKLISKKNFRCSRCGLLIPVIDGKLIFTPIPKKIIPFERRRREPEIGTPWRRANWAFLKEQILNFPKEVKILDVGAGHGDFASLYKNRLHIALDVYPYPEVDIVCDLLKVVPFKPSSFDMVLLMNVLEHVYNPVAYLKVIKQILKPGGVVIVAIPFMLKIHQAPFDFGRYTHFALEKVGQELGFEVIQIDGFFDPSGLIHESSRYYRFWMRPKLSRAKRWFSAFILGIIDLLGKILGNLSNQEKVISALKSNFPAPIGYQVVYKKPQNEGVD